MAKVRTTGSFVSDQDLTEKEFVDLYMPFGVYTEEYLKARYAWMQLRPGDDREKITNAMHDTYQKTEAYQINYLKNVKALESQLS